MKQQLHKLLCRVRGFHSGAPSSTEIVLMAEVGCVVQTCYCGIWRTFSFSNDGSKPRRVIEIPTWPYRPFYGQEKANG